MIDLLHGSADCEKAIREIFFDPCLAVHIENLAGGPSIQEAAPSPPTTTHGARSLDPRHDREPEICVSGLRASLEDVLIQAG